MQTARFQGMVLLQLYQAVRQYLLGVLLHL
ncbi:uncharacterized protein METZ01_LOCUS109393 [marine metagenome]|uniref:Uncharacterized protein n=1 Tax=marine metagenome TaxID=408172 RepID=A0A381WVH7_9ZZZZ